MVEVMNKDTGESFLMNKPAPYTMSGLALALDLSRQGLINYEQKLQFFDAIKKARQRVEAQLEERMMEKTEFTPGQIFVAKNNFGWKDKTETEHSGEIRGVAYLPQKNNVVKGKKTTPVTPETHAE